MIKDVCELKGKNRRDTLKRVLTTAIFFFRCTYNRSTSKIGFLFDFMSRNLKYSRYIARTLILY